MTHGRSQRTTVVTGAAGFVGQTLAARMRDLGYPGHVRLADRVRPLCPPGDFATVTIDLTDRGGLSALVADADHVIHLAALAGGAAETNPVASRAINLDVTLDLLEVAAPCTRLLCAGSIAVFGTLPGAVDDATPPCPTSVYGAHKRMAEIAVADAVRRGSCDATVLRLPGIVARPDGGSGFKSAFMSDVVSAISSSGPITLPVSAASTMWLMSAQCCADNLLHALELPVVDPTVLTLPALRVTMRDFVTAIATVSGGSASQVRYEPDLAVETAFGRLPPLRTVVADDLGFNHDGDVERLALQAITGISLDRSAWN